jgi:hypothetical protein
MKLSKDLILAQLAEHTSRLGFNPALIEQRSPEWFRARLGVITASKASDFLAGESTDTYKNYIAEKAAEQLAGELPEEINAKALQWGRDHESSAYSAFEFVTGLTVEQVPFIYRDLTGSFGCSPDGICSDGAGLELKCPWSSREFIKFVRDNMPKKEEIKQIQFCMWVSGASSWYVAKYDPRFKAKQLHVVKFARDEKMMREFDQRAEIALRDLQEIYEAFEQ